jgi:hypothetical protein
VSRDNSTIHRLSYENNKVYFLASFNEQVIFSRCGLKLRSHIKFSVYSPVRNLIKIRSHSDCQTRHSHYGSPNIVVEWLTLLRIPEFSGSNLGYGDRLSWFRYSWFLSAPPEKFRHRTLKLGHDRFLQKPFQFIIIHHHIIDALWSF